MVDVTQYAVPTSVCCEEEQMSANHPVARPRLGGKRESEAKGREVGEG